MSRAELRQAVSRILKRKVPDAVWEYLVDGRYIAEALQDAVHSSPAQWLAGQADKLIQLQGATEPAKPILAARRQRRQAAVPLRLAVTSDLVAAHARNDLSLKSFRAEFLKGGLIKRAEVADWIQVRKDSASCFHAVLVPIPKTARLECGKDGWECQPSLRQIETLRIENLAPLLMLDFATPDSEWAQRIPVGRDGVLRTLAELSAALASRYCWQPAQATVFVLTGNVPLLIANTVAIEPPTFETFDGHGMRPMECLSRFVVTVDSRTSPREVAHLYAMARASSFRRSRTPGKNT